MTDPELAELIRDCPTLFHMTEPGTWPSIQRHGLLSTSALLDRWCIHGDARTAIEAARRPGPVPLTHPVHGDAIIRDQKPMDDASLARCLQGGLRPTDWYRLLNARVFLWLTRARMLRLRHAAPYRHLAHDVLELDTASLVAAYRPAITLSPINSGATRLFPQPRGPGTFRTIAEYDYAHWRPRRPRGERAVELCVTGAIPDAARHVRRVTRMHPDRPDEVLFEASAAPLAAL